MRGGCTRATYRPSISAEGRAPIFSKPTGSQKCNKNESVCDHEKEIKGGEVNVRRHIPFLQREGRPCSKTYWNHENATKHMKMRVYGKGGNTGTLKFRR